MNPRYFDYYRLSPNFADTHFLKLLNVASISNGYMFEHAVLKAGSEVEMSDIQKNFQRLYDYNVMLRERLVETQSSLRALSANKSSSSSPAETQ